MSAVKIRAILFDLDDTLNDRSKSWRNFVDRMIDDDIGLIPSCSPAEIHAKIITADQSGYRPKDEFFAELSKFLPWKKRISPIQFEQYWRQTFPGCMVIRQGVVDLLNELKISGYRLGIISNGRTDMQNEKIDSMGIRNRFDSIIISEAAGVKKPDPRIFQFAIDAIGSIAKESVFIGDNPKADIQGAKKSGLKTIWVNAGQAWPNEIPRADFDISSFDEIRTCLHVLAV